LPGTRTEFWRAKIERNRTNDTKAIDALQSSGWRVAVVWECALRGADKDVGSLTDRLEAWLRSDERWLEERG
jgi:DNA mismatch endonuclease (patch repair protein)